MGSRLELHDLEKKKMARSWSAAGSRGSWEAECVPLLSSLLVSRDLGQGRGLGGSQCEEEIQASASEYHLTRKRLATFRYPNGQPEMQNHKGGQNSVWKAFSVSDHPLTEVKKKKKRKTPSPERLGKVAQLA